LNQKPFAEGQLYVFISYARPDEAVAEKVEAFLTAAGVRVFRDRSNIPPGANWDQTIAQALRECESMVLLLSSSSMPYRKEVYDEWFPFDQKGKMIYPLYIEDCELDRRFDSRNYIDARTDLHAAFEQLLDQLRLPDAKTGEDRQLKALTTFRCERIAEWSKPRYHLDNRFVNLTLLLDQGENVPQRWQRAESLRFNDLRDVMANTKEHPALVLLGAPGSGKSTLLRRLQLDHSADRLREPKEDDGWISFFIQLNGYRARASGDLPEPREWLNVRWSALYPQLPSLETYLRKGRVLLLLDALNEMPHRSTDEFRERTEWWRDFAQEATHLKNRIIFSCRSLYYGGAFLSSPDLPMPQIEIQPMNREQVREFLNAYVPAHAERVWNKLEGTPQFTIYQTPYFLDLLCKQVEAAGEMPMGRAAIFTGFVRQALGREIASDLFKPGALLNGMDYQKLRLRKWRDPFDLPEHGALIPKLSDLAFSMQVNGIKAEGAQVRIAYNKARDLVGDEALKAGEALNVLDRHVAEGEILFFHQLLQEFFAARRLAQNPDPELVHVEWAVDKVSTPLAETLAGLADGDPLPPLPQTGWEETTLTAAPMAKDPQAFIRDLIPHNLPLAARCAASSEVKIGDELKREIQQLLIDRTQDMKADLRARISVGEALGLISDPRFVRQTGPHGDYLLPPLVDIPGGTYPMGADDSVYDREKPAHTVNLAPFQIGQFPVTNAEYKLFIDAGSYEDEQWWDTPEALAWRSGEASSEGAKQAWRDDRKTLQSWSEDYIRGLVTQNRITSKQADDYITIRNWTHEQFEQQLEERYPSGKPYRQPEFWDDTRFNNPAQPVVGVTWFEARAYCNWLTANACANSEKIFRLPTEAEFEAAARGKQGRLYPYDNEFDVSRSNTFESHIRRTTPVGIFDNATPEGAFDLSGNAYTWTLSIYDQDKFPYPYRRDDGRENILATDVRRVLRGGSWFVGLLIARAVSRVSAHPADRYFSIGFRVVVVLRPPSS
jgi:formylglycine-generating enzyme required for sulfatase activity